MSSESSESSESRGTPAPLPRPGLSAAGVVVLAILGPALPEGPTRLGAFILLAVLVAAVPLALHRQTGGRSTTATDRIAQKTRSGLLGGTLAGVLVGATALAFVPLVHSLAGSSGSAPSSVADTATGDPVSGGGDAGDAASGVQALWEETLSAVEDTEPGGSARLYRVRLDSPQVWADYVTESGQLMDLYRNSDGGWTEPTATAVESLRDTFDATAVTADLDDVVSRTVTASGVVQRGLQVGQVTLERAVTSDADRALVVDSPGAQRLIEAGGTDDVKVSVDLGPDAENDGVYSFEATGDGLLAQTAGAPWDLAAVHRAGLGVLSAAGVDPATAALESFSVSVDSSDAQGQVDILLITPDARRLYLSWKPGQFADIRSGEYPGGGPDLRYPDLDVSGLQRAVDDARDRGRLVEWERDVIDLDLDTTVPEGAEVSVQISDDPAAQGVYSLDGTRLRDRE